MTEDIDQKTRTNQRVEILLKVKYNKPSDLLSDYLTSLGAGGLFINTLISLPIGEKIEFTLSFPGLLEAHTFEGIVRWRRAPGPGTPEGMAGLGVEFVIENQEQRKRLDVLLDSLREDSTHKEGSHAAPFRVLLVEDNDLIQDLFAYAVKCYHYENIGVGVPEILRASDGLEALRLLEGDPVDLALVDHFLPAMTGSTLVRRLREDPRYKDLPVLVLSVGDEQIKREALESGADLFLHKPVLNKQLVKTISILLSRTPK